MTSNMTIEKRKYLVACCLMLFLLIDSTIEWRPYRLEVLNVTVVSLNDKLTGNVTLAKDNAISIYATLKENIQRPFAKIEFNVDAGNGQFSLKYINETIDICRFFRDKRYLPVIQLIYKFSIERSNFPKSCPIKKKLYSATNVKFDVEHLPPTMPDKAMYIAVSLLSKKSSDMEILGFYKIFLQFVNFKL